MSKFLDEITVSELLPQEYEPIKFEGFENVHIEFGVLRHILSGAKYKGFRESLTNVKAVYCLTDSYSGKFYIGSAYGKDGVLQRWPEYISNKSGNNKALIELYKKKGDSYFEKNFEFSLLETFSKNTESNYILLRESYWKRIFKTKENGYNKN